VSITFHRQLLRHDPASGIIGDCYRTAIACLFNMDPADVPHFMQGRAGPPPGMRDANTWLAERGYSLVRQRHPGGIEDLLGIMRRIACDNTGSYYLLTGRSAIGCNLVVICRNDKIVWDPIRTPSASSVRRSEIRLWASSWNFWASVAARWLGYHERRPAHHSRRHSMATMGQPDRILLTPGVSWVCM